jgi:hypothetical protein
MAAIFAVTILILLGIGAIALLVNSLRGDIKDLGEAIQRLSNLASIVGSAVETVNCGLEEVRTVLVQARKINAQKADGVFDKQESAKMQPSGSLRYVPIARRRAQAERQSQGPENHQEQVRANNARVLETL